MAGRSRTSTLDEVGFIICSNFIIRDLKELSFLRLQFKSSLDLDDEPVDSLDESDDEDGVITILLDGVSSLGA